MKKVRAWLQLLLMLSVVPVALAQVPDTNGTEELQALVDQLDQGLAQLRILSPHVDSVSDSDREAVMFRRDERSFRLLSDIDNLAREAAKLPEGDPLREQVTERLRGEFGGVADLVFERTRELSGRIASLTAELDSLSGTPHLVTDAYIFSLELMRLASYSAAADLIEGRRALSLPTEDILKKLSDQLSLHAETLVGRLRFRRAAKAELELRLSNDPNSVEIDAAVGTFSTQHATDLQRLDTISKLLGRLELDNDIYKSVLLQEGQVLSIRDFDSSLFKEMWSDGLTALRESLIAKSPDLIFNIVVFMLIILVFRALSRLVSRGVSAACDRSGADMSTLLKDVLASVTGGTVMVMGVLMALSQVGISLGPMLAGLGVAGFIVGFALQDTLGNFAAGGMILIYRPYDVDDFVEVAGASGLVKKMSLVSTTINTFDNQTLIVPNNKIWGDVIKNVTAQKLRRVDMEFGIGYGDDVEKAERVLSSILDDHELVLSKPEAMIKLHTLADSSVNFAVRPWVKTPDYWNVYWDVTRAVKLRFDREGISIPFPQRDVHHYREGGA